MATSRIAALALMLAIVVGHAREAATPAACRTAGAQPPIAGANAALADSPRDLQLVFKLADAWSEAGCFSDALLVLSAARSAHPNDRELSTRLRVAHSVVSEESFFENLDRAEDQARLKRDLFRCNSLADLAACANAARLHPDDVGILTAQADALARAGRTNEAVAGYTRASALAPDRSELTAKLAAARTQATHADPHDLMNAEPTVQALPARNSVVTSSASSSAQGVKDERHTASKAAAQRVARQYSNAEPETQSH